MTTPAVSPEMNVPPEQSAVSRVINTFISPTKAFVGLERKASSWWVPFVLVIACFFGYVAIVNAKVGFDKVAENRLKAMPKIADMIEKMAPDQKAEYYAKAPRQALIGSLIQTPLFLLALWAVVAALLLATFNFALGARLRYGTTFAIVLYSALPGALKFLLAAVAVLAGINPDGFNFDNPLPTNLAHLFDPTQSAFMFWFGSTVDLFAIWTLVICAIGLSVVGKIKKGAAFAVVFGWYLIFGLGLGGVLSLVLPK